MCGGGERRTLRLAARYADESNLIARTPNEMQHKVGVLRRHCEDLGRDPTDITTSLLYVGDALVRGDVDPFIAEMRPYAELGIQTVIVMPLTDQPLTFVQRLGRDVIPRAADLSA